MFCVVVVVSVVQMFVSCAIIGGRDGRRTGRKSGIRGGSRSGRRIIRQRRRGRRWITVFGREDLIIRKLGKKTGVW